MIKINPVFHMHLRTGARHMKTALILLGYNTILALFGLFALFMSSQNENTYSNMSYYSSVLDIYAIIVVVEFVLTLLVIPVLTGTAIAGEREKQTLEILLSTSLSPIRIILGKLASSINTMIVLAFSSLPILALVFTIGGITLIDLLIFMVLVVVTAIYIGSLGILFSTIFKKTTTATVSTYAGVLILCLGSIGVVWGIHSMVQLNLNYNAAEDAIRPIADIGNWLLLLIPNPLFTCFSLIELQIGTGELFQNFIGQFGSVPIFLRKSWFILSIVVQMIMSGVFIVASAKLLDPLRRNCYRK
ncbi:MAG: ABC transporter permease [Anaerocolumna sp.]